MSALLKRVLLCALFTVGVLAVGAGTASADGLTDGPGGLIEQSQEATNSNSTAQEANAGAETNQVNVNAPIAILSWGSNNGDVWQSNDAVTVVDASNANSTSQSVGQDQAATGGGSDGSCYDPCGGSGDISQEQTGSNSNETSQQANAYGETNQVNVNAPISILSWGSNNGDVHQSNEAGTFVGASNENETTQSVAQDQWAASGGSDHSSCGCGHDGGDISQDQTASNDNATYQEANAEAETNQVNVNAPISILSWGSNNGDVWQSNDAVTVVHAGNSNATDQSIDQGQSAESVGGGASGGDIWQSQTGSNQNETSQEANAAATTNQENWNVPFSFLSFGSHGGDGCGCEGSGNDVWQSNDAFTVVHAGNANSTDQSIHQGQQATAETVDCVTECHPAPDPDPCDYGCEPDPDPCDYGCEPDPDPCGCDKPKLEPKPKPEPCGCTPPPPCACAHEAGISQSQTGSNTNSTDQSANATASTDQQNLNRPVSVLTFGSGSGDVGQANGAGTLVGAGNANGTTQSVGQDQVAGIGTEGGDD